MTEALDAEETLAELTAEEKASLLSGSGFWWTRSIDRLGVASIMLSDGPHGLRKQDGTGDHVGIGGSVPATCFPTASALASTWDRALVRRVGEAIGDEARHLGVAVVLGPGVNLKRTPLCGRNFEYLSEDPFLAGELGAAMVHGIQSRGVGASLKHFAANHQETDRLRVSAEVDDRTLREMELAAFERVVRTAGPWTVMCAYNRLNGTYASEDRWLLTDLLRGEWGFDGLVMSDWGAVADPVAAVVAGLDLEMPSTGGVSARRVAAAMADGRLPNDVVDGAVRRLLRLLERTAPGLAAGGDATDDEHHRLAREAAGAGIVLLRNDGGLLPLTAESGTIAVIGELARTPRYQGAGSSRVNPTRLEDILGALSEAVPDDVEVTFAAGYGVDDAAADADTLRDDAVNVARTADVVVVVLGLPSSYESEGFDRSHMDLPAEQVALLEAVADVNDRVVVVLANGGAVTTSGWERNAAALVEAWLGGQAGGAAVADVLLGAVNPSGRLAETIPVRLCDTAAYLDFPGEDGKVRYGEGVFSGYRHHDARAIAPSHPFGHGLSYTSFEYSGIEAHATDSPDTNHTDWRGPVVAEVAVTVTNTGPLAGAEVCQLYVGDPDASVRRPVRELKGFEKVHLEPGASTVVRFAVHERDLSFWSTKRGGWVLEPGTFTVAVGGSSADLPQRTEIEVSGPPAILPLDADSTLVEWLDHPAGGKVLRDAMESSPNGDLRPVMEDPDLLGLIGSFPLVRVNAMFGFPFGDDPAPTLLAAVDAT